MTEVWIVMHTEFYTGSESILGLFSHKEQAIQFIGEHVLENDLDTSYFELFQKNVEVLSENE